MPPNILISLRNQTTHNQMWKRSHEPALSWLHIRTACETDLLIFVWIKISHTSSLRCHCVSLDTECAFIELEANSTKWYCRYPAMSPPSFYPKHLVRHEVTDPCLDDSRVSEVEVDTISNAVFATVSLQTKNHENLFNYIMETLLNVAIWKKK